MIARHETHGAPEDIWERLAAPLAGDGITWTPAGSPTERGGRYQTRYLPSVREDVLHERLDSIVPGEWSLTFEALPVLAAPRKGAAESPAVALKARLQILGVVREDVGTGSDYQGACAEAFARVARRYGIAHELDAVTDVWVDVEGTGEGARPQEEPMAVFERELGLRRARPVRGPRAAEQAPVRAERAVAQAAGGAGAATTERAPAPRTLSIPRAPVVGDVPPCPVCGGRMWDNRLGKRNPKAPDFKCRDRSCTGVVWPPRDGARATPTQQARAEEREAEPHVTDPHTDHVLPARPSSLALGDPEIPF